MVLAKSYKWLTKTTDSFFLSDVGICKKRTARVGASGLVTFVPAIAYHFCLKLLAAFSKPGASTLANLCTSNFVTNLYALI